MSFLFFRTFLISNNLKRMNTYLDIIRYERRNWMWKECEKVIRLMEFHSTVQIHMWNVNVTLKMVRIIKMEIGLKCSGRWCRIACNTNLNKNDTVYLTMEYNTHYLMKVLIKITNFNRFDARTYVVLLVFHTHTDTRLALNTMKKIAQKYGLVTKHTRECHYLHVKIDN